MHKIYETQGSFDIEYQLPKIIYSSLISMVLNTILKLLALSDDVITDFKQNKSKVGINTRFKGLMRKIKIKFVFYFIISFIFVLCFWYYMSMFGAVYRNTQYHLLKDTLISYGMGFITPFGIYLLPGLFRIPALSDDKKNSQCLYKFSKILQILATQ